MHRPKTTKILPANFAVSSGQKILDASAQQYPRQQTARYRFYEAAPVHKEKVRTYDELVALNEARILAWCHWRALYADPNVWIDDLKRHTMLRARLAYQDLVLELTIACRNSGIDFDWDDSDDV
jgi:hypothetical protein